MKKPLAILLSLSLGLFLVDGLVSLLDDTIIVVSGAHALDLIRGLVFVAAVGLALVVYLLIGITPLVPKRLFLPVTLFSPLALLGMVPIAIYHFHRLQQAAWLISLAQVVLAAVLLRHAQGAWAFRWPVLPEEKLQGRSFSWWNLTAFVLANLLVVLPALFVYLGLCASLAVDHLSGGFLVLHRDGLAVRARQYTRADGKSIQLIPMMHIGERGFYRQVAAAVPTNAVVLLEGVTDQKHLLKHKLSYKRMAASLGLSEQRESFAPGGTQARPADVDVDQFSSETVDFLNSASLIHSQGLTPEVLHEFFGKTQSPDLMERLWEDLLVKRNQHLLQEVRTELTRSQNLVIPWGAAHMPGMERELEKAGFHLRQSHEYEVLNFRRAWR